MRYHPSEANVVANALSWKERVKPKRVRAMSSIKDRILSAQKEAVDEYVGLQKGLDEMIEHRRADKMYYDLRDRYWWLGMKKDIAEYEGITMDFVTKLPRTGSGHDTIWVIVDRLTKSAHFLPIHPSKIEAVKNWKPPRTPSKIELFGDYDCEMRYHPSEANVVANALSWKERVKPKRVRAMSSIKDRILSAQKEAVDEARYWWLGMKKDIAEYEGITMDFVTKLPRTGSGHDTIWVIVDRLTKSAHFLPIREDYKMDRLARLYLNKIVARHGMSISIISDRDSRFTSRFWQSMQEALGTRLDMSTAYHPQTDGQKSVIRQLCRLRLEKVARDRQKSYADKRRKPLELSVEPVEILDREFKKLKRSRIAIVKDRMGTPTQVCVIIRLDGYAYPVLCDYGSGWAHAHYQFSPVTTVLTVNYFDRFLSAVDGTASLEGDPLSPFLFIINMEGLHVAVEDAISAGLYRCLTIDTISFSHLFFVDDAIFIGDWPIDNITYLAAILECFHRVFGLTINFHKSNLFGFGVHFDEVTRAALLTGCNAMRSPFTYLGLPIDCNMGLVKSWDPVVDKLTKRLSKWKSSMFSIGGRATLTSSVLGSLGTYYFSLFPVPVTICNSLESIRARFFWGSETSRKKIPWISWNSVIASKHFGGLGIGSLYSLNHALIQKWCWYFVNYPQALWVRLISAIHGKPENAASFFSNTGTSSVWGRIVGSINTMHDKGYIPLSTLARRVNNGISTKFWYDTWVNNSPLRQQYPCLFRLAANKDCTVRDCWNSGWHVIWSRPSNFGSNASRIEDLYNTIGNLSLKDSEDDWLWSIGTRSFSVRSWDNEWKYQLLSVACLWLAAKMEELDVPLLMDLQVSEPPFVFRSKTIPKMELLILSLLDWRIRPVTPFDFIDYFVLMASKYVTDEVYFRRKCSDLVVQTIRGRGSAECFYQTVNKEMVRSCHRLMNEYLLDTCPLADHKVRKQPDEPPASPDGVLDAVTCVSCDTHSGDGHVVPSPIFEENVRQAKRVRSNVQENEV
nr:RNA-directed DNA polymerase, eukaryota, reverse transcriptase zinc-binding domain protein [Tanacetum cinerariifolium]